MTLCATPAADVALGIGDTAVRDGQRATRKASTRKRGSPGKGTLAAPGRRGRATASKRARRGKPNKRNSLRSTANDGKHRPDTEQAKLIKMLQRKRGASVNEVAKALDWQPHTVRGAIAGALKRRLGLTVTSESDERRGRVYRIWTEEAAR